MPNHPAARAIDAGARGASAALSPSSAIFAGGNASMTATANGIGGSYTVTRIVKTLSIQLMVLDLHVPYRRVNGFSCDPPVRDYPFLGMDPSHLAKPVRFEELERVLAMAKHGMKWATSGERLL
jgi:hypothetical protein